MRRHRLTAVGPAFLFSCFALACVDDGPTASPPPQFSAVADATVTEFGPDAEFARMAEQSPGFGGMFYDGNGKLNVYMTATATASTTAKQNVLDNVNAKLSASGRATVANEQVVVRAATRDYKELVVLHRRAFPVMANGGVAFTDIDETRNRLVIGVTPGTSEAAIRTATQNLGVPADAFDVEVAREIAPLSGTLEDYREPLGGGSQIGARNAEFGWICTMGFSAYRSSTDKQQKYFFTNSHCTDVRAEVNATQLFAPFPNVGPLAGVEVEDPPYSTTICIPGFLCRWSDAALVRYADGVPASVGLIHRTQSFGTGANPGSLVVDETQPQWSVVSERPWSYVGEIVDKVGRSTGWTRGPVTRNCANLLISLTPRTALLCQAFVSAAVYFGDSGSPVFQPIGNSANVRLHGILWGGPAGPPFNFFVYSIMDGIREDFDGPVCGFTGPRGRVQCPSSRSFVTN